MKKHIISFLGICSLFFFGKLLFSNATEGENQKNNGSFEQDENKTIGDAPQNIEFAGQHVPLANPSVKRRFEAELKPSKSLGFIAVSLVSKADKYFPLISPILARYGIPDDFKYIPLMESGFTNKVSRSGASGPWQFMPETAKRYGLVINSQVDERYDLTLSTEAACQYLVHLYNQLHDWTLAAAAFNKGLDGIKNAIKLQKKRSYYKLRLNREAQQYVFRILAAKELVENPGNYGYLNRSAHFHYSIPTFKLKVNNSISNLAVFAKKHGISLQTLRAYNPWLKTNRFDNPKRRICYLEIPILNEVAPSGIQQL